MTSRKAVMRSATPMPRLKSHHPSDLRLLSLHKQHSSFKEQCEDPNLNPCSPSSTECGSSE